MAGRRKGKRVKRSEGEWGALLSRFARSGLSVEAFCQREAIGVASFYRWRGLLGEGCLGGDVVHHCGPQKNAIGSMRLTTPRTSVA
jgi:hypothetical protein